MEWTLLTPYTGQQDGQWLDAFLPTGSTHRITAVAARYAHSSSRPATSRSQWQDYARHAIEGWSHVTRTRERAGVITCFPQLAVMTGLRKRVSLRRIPVVAWTFNLGHVPVGAARRIARVGLAPLDRIIVHSRAEIDAYSRCFEIRAERFRFVPLQAPHRHVSVSENLEQPFVLAMGSARRDYRLLIAALARLGLPSIIVAAPHAVVGIDLPANVQVRSGLTQQQCFDLLQAARIHVIPIRNTDTASGQVTLVESMSHGRPTIVTKCIATVDYATDRENVLFVPQGDRDALCDAIAELWGNDGLRTRLGTQAQLRARSEFSDEAIGGILRDVLDELV